MAGFSFHPPVSHGMERSVTEAEPAVPPDGGPQPAEASPESPKAIQPPSTLRIVPVT